MREVDLQRIADREEENKTLMDDVAANRKLVNELEASLELARNAAEVKIYIVTVVWNVLCCCVVLLSILITSRLFMIS